MFHRRRLRKTLIFFFVFLIPIVQCKKTSTSPDFDTLTHPVIWLNSFEISFTASESGADPSSQTLQVKNSGPETLKYTLSSEADWVSFDPAEGSSTGQVNNHTISVIKNGFVARDEAYTTKILITSDQAYNNPQEVLVNLNITKNPVGEIWMNTKNLTFSAQEGKEDPPSQNISVRNDKEGDLVYQLSADASWLTVTPSSAETGRAEKKHAVSVDTFGMTAGSYTGTITITSPNASNSPQNVKVALNISKELPPQIHKDKTSLSFNAIAGGSDPAPQSFSVKNSGGGTLNYDINWNPSWLGVNPAGGSSTGQTNSHTVSVDTGGLAAGDYQGTITITDQKASNSPQTIGVILHIGSPSTDNEVGITISPKDGGTNSIVTITVSIKGNTSPIADGFGMQLHYDPSIFVHQSTAKGTLTSDWAAVDGNASSGTIIVGGFRGSGSVISTGRQGSISVVKLKVTHSGSSDITSTIRMDSLSDDLAGMRIVPSTAPFTYRH